MLIAKVLNNIQTSYGEFKKDDILLANDGSLFFQIRDHSVEILKVLDMEAIPEGIKTITDAEMETYISKSNTSELVKMQNEIDRLKKENEELKKDEKKEKKEKV